MDTIKYYIKHLEIHFNLYYINKFIYHSIPHIKNINIFKFINFFPSNHLGSLKTKKKNRKKIKINRNYKLFSIPKKQKINKKKCIIKEK